MATVMSRLGAALKMVRHMLRAANEPTRRFRLLWNLFGIALVGLFAIVGAGYAVGGKAATNSDTLRLLLNIEQPIGGLHAHGFIMLFMAMLLAHGLGFNYRRSTHIALLLYTFYSLVVAAMIFGGWTLYKVSFGAPWWYLYSAFQAMVLMTLAPVVLSVPGASVDVEPGVGEEGDGA